MAFPSDIQRWEFNDIEATRELSYQVGLLLKNKLGRMHTQAYNYYPKGSKVTAGLVYSVELSLTNLTDQVVTTHTPTYTALGGDGVTEVIQGLSQWVTDNASELLITNVYTDYTSDQDKHMFFVPKEGFTLKEISKVNLNSDSKKAWTPSDTPASYLGYGKQPRADYPRIIFTPMVSTTVSDRLESGVILIDGVETEYTSSYIDYSINITAEGGDTQTVLRTGVSSQNILNTLRKMMVNEKIKKNVQNNLNSVYHPIENILPLPLMAETQYMDISRCTSKWSCVDIHYPEDGSGFVEVVEIKGSSVEDPDGVTYKYPNSDVVVQYSDTLLVDRNSYVPPATVPSIGFDFSGYVPTVNANVTSYNQYYTPTDIINQIVPPVEDLLSWTGVQIGQAIITGEDKWVDENGVEVYDLLDQGSLIPKGEQVVLDSLYPAVAVIDRRFPPIGALFGAELVADSTDSVGGAVVDSDTSLGYSDSGVDLSGTGTLTYDIAGELTSSSCSIAASVQRSSNTTYWGTVGLLGDSQGGWSTARFIFYCTRVNASTSRVESVITHSSGSAVNFDFTFSAPLGAKVVIACVYDDVAETLTTTVYDTAGFVVASDSRAVAGVLVDTPQVHTLSVARIAGVEASGHYSKVCVWQKAVTKEDIFLEGIFTQLPTLPTETGSPFPYKIVADLTETTVTDIVNSTDPFGDESLVAKYQLDGDATDLLGGYDGTATNVTYDAGEFGQAGVFNGSSSYVDTTMKSSFGSVGDFSVSAFFKVTNASNGSILSNRNYIVQDFRGFELRVKADGTIAAIFWQSEAGVSAETVVGLVQEDVWYHVCMVSDRDSQSVVYLDSVEVAVVGATTGQDLDSSESFSIGSFVGSNAVWFDGLIDQVEIYNRVLTASEVNSLRTQTIETTTPEGGAQ